MPQRLRKLLKNSWIVVAFVAILALAYATSSTVWAAPSPANRYQTVPKPTPTPDDDPMATATPRPDDDDDDDDSDSSGSNQGDTADDTGSAPLFFLGPDDTRSATAIGLTASVSVATLNVREGPGTDFPLVGSLGTGDVVNVLARDEGNAWWYVCCIPGSNDGGWISAQLLTPDFDRALSSDLIPVFGSEPELAESVQAVADSAESVTAATGEELPIVLHMSLLPPFVQQGDEGQIVLEVSNPNLADALNVELSDQLPAELTLLNVVVNGQAQVSDQASAEGAPLVLVRWETIPAGESVKATLTVKVTDDLVDGYVFDNLAGARGSNTSYASGAVTIGMPPLLLPDFQ